jgi:hypothetical protein
MKKTRSRKSRDTVPLNHSRANLIWPVGPFKYKKTNKKKMNYSASVLSRSVADPKTFISDPDPSTLFAAF